MPNVSSLRGELKEWQRYLRLTETTQSSSSPNLTECLEHADEGTVDKVGEDDERDARVNSPQPERR